MPYFCADSEIIDPRFVRYKTDPEIQLVLGKCLCVVVRMEGVP